MAALLMVKIALLSLMDNSDRLSRQAHAVTSTPDLTPTNDNAQKSIQRVFEDSGFNSKTTFNTLFKKHTGQTPSEYRKAVQHGNVCTAQA
jgi:AraC-like DNA-binding protein